MIRVTRRHRPPLCPLCKDLLSHPTTSCEGCSSTYHLDCGLELGGCPTLGCPGELKEKTVFLANCAIQAARDARYLREEQDLKIQRAWRRADREAFYTVAVGALFLVAVLMLTLLAILNAI